jgi:DNA-binding FadR family transcriptional regulator
MTHYHQGMRKMSTVLSSPATGVADAGGGTAVPADAAARPRRRSRSLALDLVEDLSGRIRTQILRPGDKLPTESAIMEEFGVSRTVVREALSKLQAAGLVETHHGIGTFVLEARPGGIFRLDPADVATSIDAIAVLELRISLETESAVLASARRTDEQLRAMREALDEFERNVASGGDTVSPDFRFHLEISKATGNRYFADILDHHPAHPHDGHADSAGRPVAVPAAGEPRARGNLQRHRAARRRIGPRGHAYPPDQQPRALAARPRGGPGHNASLRAAGAVGDCPAGQLFCLVIR